MPGLKMGIGSYNNIDVYSMKVTITVTLAEEATSSATCMMLFCMLIKADRLRKIIYMRGVRLRKIITNSI